LVCFSQWRDIDPGLIELFVNGKENPLPDSGRLDGLGLGSGSVVFMLERLGWRWEACGSDITLSGEGLVATKDKGESFHLTTGGSPMTEGRHYWEVELAAAEYCDMMVGAVRPGLDHEMTHWETNNAYYLNGEDGALEGNGKDGAHPQGTLASGERIGVLLDLDAGWMRFYRDGKRCGPGFTEGVTGPLVRAVELRWKGNKAVALPAAVAPEEAGAANEPWESPPRTPPDFRGEPRLSEWGGIVEWELLPTAAAAAAATAAAATAAAAAADAEHEGRVAATAAPGTPDASRSRHRT
jgi:hypothetical protein